MQNYDFAVMGSGFAGSLMAMILKRQGRSVVLVEKGRHPRVVIGESSTPLSNLLLETLADRFDLPMLKPLTKWGTWQRTYPGIACGLKRGFTFYHHQLGGDVSAAREPDEHLLVAASPDDSIADTHWFRADVDEFLMQQARALEVDYIDECDIQQSSRDAQGWVLSGRCGAGKIHLRASFMIDATGPRGFLHRALGLSEAMLPDYPATTALHSHFFNMNAVPSSLNASFNPPYPPDAAALHHVFEGGWMWVLSFNNGWTSAGFAVKQALGDRYGFADGGPAWDRVLENLPAVKQQFRDATLLRPLTYAAKISFRSAEIAGTNWAMLPSAAGFVDPLLSTGFPLTLLGVTRLADLFEADWNTPRQEQSIAAYAANTDSELLATARLIAALYANMGDFPTFRVLSLLYFAAASYAETVRRLGKPALASSFLLHDDERFGPASRRILQRALTPLNPVEKLQVQREIYLLIEQFDVAGLCKHPGDECYPVLAEDLYAGATKVGASRSDIAALLQRTGFNATTKESV